MLFNMIGCVDRPDEGEVVIAGCKVNELSDDKLSDFRAENIGFISAENTSRGHDGSDGFAVFIGTVKLTAKIVQ